MLTGTDVGNSIAIYIYYTYYMTVWDHNGLGLSTTTSKHIERLKEYIEILVIFGIFHHSCGTFVTDMADENCTGKIFYVWMSTVFVLLLNMCIPHQRKSERLSINYTWDTCLPILLVFVVKNDNDKTYNEFIMSSLSCKEKNLRWPQNWSCSVLISLLHGNLCGLNCC